MEDKQKRYLDKVVGLLVRGTKIDYEQSIIYLPYEDLPSELRFSIRHFSNYHKYFPSVVFEKYCNNIYGLTTDEIDYVWGEYRFIITDKIDKGDNLGFINENIDREEKFISKLVKHITLPYFYNLEIFGVPKLLWEKILSKKFNQEVRVESYGRYTNVFNSLGIEIYYENSDGYWEKQEYDLNGNEIYSENSDGYWEKQEYDLNGNLIYSENSVGYWYKYEYDLNGKEIYYENSDGKIIDRRNISL